VKRDARTDGIVAAATALASKLGFDGVRQRDVAARAGVTLRTLYRRFGSKEELLAATLELTAVRVERRLKKKPVRGATAAARLRALFRVLTDEQLRDPRYARAVIRAMASGVPGVAAQVVAYQERTMAMVLGAMRPGAVPDERDRAVALVLLQIWFAAQVGWSAGLADEAGLVAQMALAIDLLQI